MAIHSVGSGLSAIANMSAHQKSASVAAAKAADDRSHDRGETVVAEKPSSSTNLQGQSVGKIVNTAA